MKKHHTHRKRTKTARRKTRRQYGASHTKPIAPYPMSFKGGFRSNKKLGARSNKRLGGSFYKLGGSFYKLGPPVPGPFVGAPWTSNPNSWSGYGMSNENHGNHFAQNMYQPDTKMMIKYTGGKRSKHKRSKRSKRSKRKRSKRSKRKGGASFLQNAANSYRDVAYNFDSAYNALRGYNPPVNPAPYKDQLQPRQI